MLSNLLVVWKIRLRTELGYWQDWDESIRRTIKREKLGPLGFEIRLRLPSASGQAKAIQFRRIKDAVPEVRLMSAEEVEAFLRDVLHRIDPSVVEVLYNSRVVYPMPSSTN